MARPRKFQSPTMQVTVRVPRHVVRALDREAEKKNVTRSDVVTQILIERFGDKPLPASVFE